MCSDSIWIKCLDSIWLRRCVVKDMMYCVRPRLA
jgi:hypothetical protein